MVDAISFHQFNPWSSKLCCSCSPICVWDLLQTCAETLWAAEDWQGRLCDIPHLLIDWPRCWRTSDELRLVKLHATGTWLISNYVWRYPMLFYTALDHIAPVILSPFIGTCVSPASSLCLHLYIQSQARVNLERSRLSNRWKSSTRMVSPRMS